MGSILLIIIAIILAANGDYTFFWIFGGIAVLYIIASIFGGSGKTSPAKGERPRTRIDVPHYYDADEYVCTICGHRFDSDMMTCPHCGVRFNNTRTDDRAFIEEEDFEDWMDEMDEEEGW